MEYIITYNLTADHLPTFPTIKCLESKELAAFNNIDAFLEAIPMKALFVDLKLLYFCYINNIYVSQKPAGKKIFPALLMIHMVVSEETSPTEKKHLINDLETLFLFS